MNWGISELTLVRKLEEQLFGRQPCKYVPPAEEYCAKLCLLVIMWGSASSNVGPTWTHNKSANTNQGDLDITNGAPGDTVQHLAWNPAAQHDSFLAGASWDKVVRVWQISAGGGWGGASSLQAQPKVSQNHEGPALWCTWKDDGCVLFSGGADNQLRALDMGSGQSAAIGKHDAPIRSCVWLSGMNVVCSGGWDNKLKFWDCKQPNPVAELQMPGKVYYMDAHENVLLVLLADRKVAVYDTQQLASGNQNPQNSGETKLKMQTRCGAIMKDKTGYAVGAIEGRAQIESFTGQADKSFLFKCHRDSSVTPTAIWPVNAIDFHPTIPDVLLTAGSDGIISTWDKGIKSRVKQFASVNYPILSAKFNRSGDKIAYSVGYDWTKGHEHNNANIPKKVFVKTLKEEEVKSSQSKSNSRGGWRR